MPLSSASSARKRDTLPASVRTRARVVLRAFQLGASYASASYAFGGCSCERHVGSGCQSLPTECPAGNIDRENWPRAFGACDYEELEDEDYFPDFVSERGDDPQTLGAHAWVNEK